jgi:VIT1/CCC1 family predicted Fe2+/Mn2+ transporter
MKHSFKVGFSFGLTSGVITTLGLMVGLSSGTASKLAVIGGILIIAIADSLSDALGIHMSEESENKHSVKEIWQSTLSTFISKFAFAITFVVPVFLFELSTAVIVSIIWGLSLITVFSYIVAIEQKRKASKMIGEHLFIAVLVVIITHFMGKWIALAFS